MCLCVSKKKLKSVNYFYEFMKHPKKKHFFALLKLKNCEKQRLTIFSILEMRPFQF
jgi:hypothetical protein